MRDKQLREKELIRKSYQHKAAAEELIRQKSLLLIEIEKIQSYLDKKEEVAHALNLLQIRTQEKTKDIYEKLLTKLIHEIKGSDKENHKVVLHTKIKNNKPWLDIEIENEAGYSRDVYLDKGGSIENIVAMGLRFITLSRTSNRRFLAFDEADKNLSPKYMPQIAKTLFELSKQIGMQVLYISHHDQSNFEGFARIINITRSNDTIITECVSDIDESTVYSNEEVNDDLQGIGLRYLRLQNFKQHENTLIELSRFVTVITGDVDIGKSTIIQAIDAVNKNLGREGLIRDNQQACRVEIGLESNTTLTWSYKLRGNKKTRYSVTDDKNVEIQRSDDGNSPPEWLSDYLGMPAFKEFDIHISDKQNGSFILDPKISGHKRAEIMSLGQESNQVMSMIKLHGQEIERKVKSVNQYKNELISVKNRLKCYRHIYDIDTFINSYDERKRENIDRENFLLDLKNLMSKISKNKDRLDILNKLGSLEKKEVPNYIDSTKNIEIIRNIERTKILIAQLNRADAIKFSVPEFKVSQSEIHGIGIQIAKLREQLNVYENISIEKIYFDEKCCAKPENEKLINNYAIAKEKINILETKLPNVIQEPEGGGNPGISQSGKKISSAIEEIKEISEEIRSAEIEKINNDEEIKEISKLLGNKCPLCGNKIKLGADCHENI